MKGFLLVSVFILFVPCQSLSQHFGVIGVGGTFSFYTSAELDSFTQTYNFVNAPNLNSLLSKFNSYEGLRFEGGYRYIGRRLTAAALLGWQRLTSKNNARFNNGDNRTFKLRSDVFYLEGEAGRTLGIFFVGGVATLFLNRQFSIKAAYSNLSGSEYIQRLDGTYSAETSISADLGLSLGVRQNRMFVIAKISHPVFASDKADRIRDAAPEKVNNGSDIFPENYIKFFDASYNGVPNNLDGWKVSVSVAFAFIVAK